MTDVIIVGASGFGREVLETIEQINKIDATWNVLGFIDDNLHALDNFEIGYHILGTIEDWKPSNKEKYVLAIAAPTTKERVVSKLKERGAAFATVIASTATIGDRTTIGEGVVIFGETGISVDCKIGDFVK